MCTFLYTAPHNWVDGEDWPTHSCHRNTVLQECVTVHCWVATTWSAVKCKHLVTGSTPCHVLTWDGELWGSAQHIKDTCSQNREALLCVWYTGEAYMEGMSVHSQYTSTVRVKVADPATLIACCNLLLPLSSRVMSAIIVRLVVVMYSCISDKWALKVTLSMVDSGLASIEKGRLRCSPSVGDAVTVKRKVKGV